MRSRARSSRYFRRRSQLTRCCQSTPTVPKFAMLATRDPVRIRLPGREQGYSVRKSARSSQRYQLRPSYAMIPRRERHAMDHAGRGDDLVRPVAPHVQVADGSADIEAQWPGVQPRQRTDKLGVVQVHGNPAELRELADLPQDDRRDTPCLTRQER